MLTKSTPRMRGLVAIKALHTAVWLFFAGCVIAIPVAGANRQFMWATGLSGLVLIECANLSVELGRLHH